MTASMKELLDQRMKLSAEARELLDKVKREGREFTEYDRKSLDALDDQVSSLSREIDKAEKAARGFSLPAAGPSHLTSPAGKQWLAASEKLTDVTHTTFDAGSPARALRAMITGDWRDAGREQLAVQGGGPGGFTMSPELSSWWIDRARADSVCVAAGAGTFLMQTSEMRVPRLTGDPTAVWRAENVEIASSDPTFGAAQLRARTVACLVPCSLELIQDSPHASEMIVDSISKTLALAVDYAMLEGPGGSGEMPVGLWTDSGVQSYALSGLISADALSQAAQLVRAANHVPNAIIYSSRTAFQLDRRKFGDGQYLANENGPQSIRNLPRFISTQISEDDGTGTTTSHAYLGDFSKMSIAMRPSVGVEVFREGSSSTYNAVSQLGVLVRGFLRVDSYISHPAAFCKVTGLTAS